MADLQVRKRIAGTWLDRAVSYVAPQLALQRARARVAAELLLRHYEGAASGRRTDGWNRATGDANAVVGVSLARLRDVARDLVRNNPNAKSARRTITNHVVGWGIVGKPATKNKRAHDLWKAWAETRACDSDGQHDFTGLQKLVMRTVFESGEALVRRRFRRPDDVDAQGAKLPIPMQIEVLEPDYIDTSKNETFRSPDGIVVRQTIHGVEYDALGRRAAYWLFREHPGSDVFTAAASVRVPAENVLHVYEKERPKQVRGVTWLASVILRMKDFDEYEDATLMKQKIAACLAVLTSSADGSPLPLGTVTAGGSAVPGIDSIEPGMIAGLAPGQEIEVVQPPTVREYSDYTKTSLRAIATGIGVTYEDLTGDYTGLPFSAARMSRLAHWDRVEDWRWQMLVPMLCDPVWAWAMQVAGIFGKVGPIADGAPPIAARWTAPPAPMIDPGAEGLAHMRNIRTGITTLFEVLRERGYDPEEVLREYADANQALDALGIVLDSDPRQTTQQGGPRQQGQASTGGGDEPPEPDADPADAEPAGDEDDEEEEDGQRSTPKRKRKARR